MQPKYHVKLRILDEEMLPEEITEQTGISPSKIWYKNDLRPKTCIKEKESGWELESTLHKERLLAEHIVFLLSVIEPVYVQFQNCTQRYYSQLSCAIYFDDERPEICFDKNLIIQLADLNLNVDIDIYGIEE